MDKVSTVIIWKEKPQVLEGKEEEYPARFTIFFFIFSKMFVNQEPEGTYFKTIYFFLKT
jgi:hypothetical protein